MCLTANYCEENSNYSGRQNELQNGGQEPRSSLFGEPSMAAFNASKRLFFCLRIVDR